jgi:hypothetical protein
MVNRLATPAWCENVRASQVSGHSPAHSIRRRKMHFPCVNIGDFLLAPPK